ncbi:glucose-1-phosphate thymidylyltransferase RfbA [Campylobacter concisus]|jgi:glucose-1-phosphate thymidylyltransferase|uniref:glucose-1-phosphate thymidylyltransferase RfbA n=1 Tax=Campylobacter concisus TaxID=199 RepID=UPI000CD80017|nr:glucose-1-phosphate thymidylyltransferase RfbA [Campylobacter concisus]
MKGIILAGGSGTRLYPITKGIVKQLLPIYNKPMIYYPLSVLMLANIKEILIISTPKDIDRFKDIFGDGSGLGLDIQYAIQNHPNGLAEAFIIGEKFIGNDDVCLVLGDNLIYGEGLIKLLENSKQKVENDKKGVVFGYYVDDASAYGVVEFDKNKKAISIEEKPKSPKSNYAVIGLYFYPNDVVQIAKNVKPSDRGELEITTINQEYLRQEKLYVEVLGRGYAWLDTGTHESLLEASNFIEVIEKRQGLKIACIEEIAYKKGYISKEQLIALGNELSKNSYGKYLLKVANT